MAPNGFIQFGKEKEKPPPPPSNLLLYGIILTVVGLASNPFFGVLIAKASDEDRQRLYILLKDVVGVLGVIVGLSIVGISAVRKQLRKRRERS